MGSYNTLADLLDFYRTLGYDVVSLYRKDGDPIDIILHDTVLLRAGVMGKTERNGEPKIYTAQSDGTVSVRWDFENLSAQDNDCTADEFTKNIRQCVNAANDYLVQYAAEHCPNDHVQKTTVSDLLRFMTDSLRSGTKGYEPSLFAMLSQTKLAYQNADFLAFQNAEFLKINWDSKSVYIQSGHHTRYCKYGKIYESLYCPELAVNVHDILRCEPIRFDKVITDPEILNTVPEIIGESYFCRTAPHQADQNPHI